MPLVDWSDPTAWETWYQGAGHPPGYTRASHGGIEAYEQRLDLLEAHFTIPATARILIAGCGFGFLIEAFHRRGYPNVWGIDSSSDIAARRGTEAVGSVLWVEDDIRGGGQVRNALRQMSGAQGNQDFDWVISEFVLESYSDAELPALYSAAEFVCDGPNSQIVHMVDEPPFTPAGVFNEKTLAEWKATEPSHSFLSRDSGAL